MSSFQLTNINLLVALSLSLFIAWCVWTHSQRRLSLPPGPKGWPIIGNIFDIPKEKAHIAYMEMGRKYGSDLLYLNMAGTSLLVLNSAKAANDLFAGRPTLYSNRPRLPMLCELMGWDFNLTFLSYGTQWRESRALLTQQISSLNLNNYLKPCMQDSVHAFLTGLLDTPKEFEEHLRFLSGGNIISSVYGIPVNDPHDPYLELARKVLHGLAEAGTPGTYLVDAFPMLKNIPGWLPGSGFKRKAAYERNVLEAMIKQPFEFVKKNMESGTAKASIASRALQQMQDDGSWSKEKEDLLRNILAVIYAGGADTTAAVINTVFLALVHDTNILKKGQAAVDAVVGADRLPSFNDEGKIPYVDALVMEALRWRPIGPLAVAHCTASADIYRGHYIPANAVVMGNAWAILHDPATYGEDVDQFRPERFLNSNGTLNSTVPFPDATFGFGRRICPGKFFAQNMVWIAVASLLACFDLAKALDKDAVEIEPSTDYTDGFLSYPRPYGCAITPRSQAAERLIRQSSDLET